MVNVNPLLRRRLIRERDDARSDERLKSRFLSMRLNVPSRGDDVALLTVEDWLHGRLPQAAGAIRDGLLCGVEIGANRSWNAAVAVDGLHGLTRADCSVWWRPSVSRRWNGATVSPTWTRTLPARHERSTGS